MRVPTCQWRCCDQPAELAVLIGEDVAAAVREGAYCTPHATISRRFAARRTAQPVWFGPVPPVYPPLRLVGDGAGDRPLHRHLWSRARRAASE